MPVIMRGCLIKIISEVLHNNVQGRGMHHLRDQIQ